MPLSDERRRKAPSALKLKAGPTPPRGTPKYTLPSLPGKAQSSMSTLAVSTQPATSTSSSPEPDSASKQPTTTTTTTAAGSDMLAPSAHPLPPPPMLPTAMTQGASSGLGAVVQMPDCNAVKAKVANGGLGLGPWDRSTHKISQAEIDRLLPAPPAVVANPSPVVFGR